MKYKKLGSAGFAVSAVSVGTWGIGGSFWDATTKEESLRAIDTMLDQGVNLIDTAPIYGFGNPTLDDLGFGHAEILVGEAIRQRRDKVLVFTKCGLNYDRSIGPKSLCKNTSYEHIIAECEESLRRLGTDYIDLLFVHWPDANTPIEEVVRAMDRLIRDGKIRSYGLSNFTPEETLKAHEMLPVTAVQLKYSMVDTESEQVLRQLHEKGIGTMTYGSLGAGILGGHIREIPDFGAMDTRNTFYDYYREPKFSRIMDLLKEMDVIAEQRQVPLSQIAINWSIGQPYVDTAICGVSKSTHALENCRAAEWELTAAETESLDEAIRRIRLS